MQATRPRYEQVFFDWRGGPARPERAGGQPTGRSLCGCRVSRDLRAALAAYDAAPRCQSRPRLFQQTTPRTMLIEEVEAIWAPIAEDDDWSAFAAARGDRGNACGTGLYRPDGDFHR